MTTGGDGSVTTGSGGPPVPGVSAGSGESPLECQAKTALALRDWASGASMVSSEMRNVTDACGAASATGSPACAPACLAAKPASVPS